MLAAAIASPANHWNRAGNHIIIGLGIELLPARRNAVRAKRNRFLQSHQIGYITATHPPGRHAGVLRKSGALQSGGPGVFVNRNHYAALMYLSSASRSGSSGPLYMPALIID